MIGFTYSLIPVDFGAILMSLFGFLSQKKIPSGIFKTRSYFKQKLSKKMQYLAPPPSPCIINFSFFKNAIKSEPLGVRGYYFQDFHISMIPTNGKNFKKIHELRVTYPGWLSVELPNEAFFPLSNHHSSSCQGNIFLHQNHAAY